MTVAGRRLLTSCAPPFAAAMTLAGCWAAPVATVQPPGEPRLIQSAIQVESVEEAAVVAAIDRSAGTIVLRTHGMAETAKYRTGPKLADLTDIKAGDVVQVTVAEELAVYVLRDGELPGQGRMAADARVLAVDPSYRLLRLQYPNGRSETLKVPIGTRLEQMSAGDSVVIEPIEVLALRRKG